MSAAVAAAAAAALLVLVSATANASETRVYVRAHQRHHERYLGCTEPHLQAFEHLLLPRRLHCSATECWDEGSIRLAVDSVECIGGDECTAQVFCQSRLRDVNFGLAATLCGFAAVLIFVCAPMARREASIKLHKT